MLMQPFDGKLSIRTAFLPSFTEFFFPSFLWLCRLVRILRDVAEFPTHVPSGLYRVLPSFTEFFGRFFVSSSWDNSTAESWWPVNQWRWMEVNGNEWRHGQKAQQQQKNKENNKRKCKKKRKENETTGVTLPPNRRFLVDVVLPSFTEFYRVFFKKWILHDHFHSTRIERVTVLRCFFVCFFFLVTVTEFFLWGRTEFYRVLLWLNSSTDSTLFAWLRSAIPQTFLLFRRAISLVTEFFSTSTAFYLVLPSFT